MSALAALSAAKAAGVKLTLDGDGIIIETKTPPLPADLVALLKASKPSIMHVLELREAARDAIAASPPPDCEGRLSPPGPYGVRRPVWDIAKDGLRRFCSEGWADQAAMLGWTKDELYRVPPLWSQIWLIGAALMIGERKVIAVTADNIVVETAAGSQLKFRRLGREHIA
jgi:hypothetical protein